MILTEIQIRTAVGDFVFKTMKLYRVIEYISRRRTYLTIGHCLVETRNPKTPNIMVEWGLFLFPSFSNGIPIMVLGP